MRESIPARAKPSKQLSPRQPHRRDRLLPDQRFLLIGIGQTDAIGIEPAQLSRHHLSGAELNLDAQFVVNRFMQPARAGQTRVKFDHANPPPLVSNDR